MGEGAMVVQYDGTVVLFASGHAPINSSAAAANPCQTPWKIQTIAFKAHFCYLKNLFFKKYYLFRKNNNYKSKSDEASVTELVTAILKVSKCFWIFCVIYVFFFLKHTALDLHRLFMSIYTSFL